MYHDDDDDYYYYWWSSDKAGVHTTEADSPDEGSHVARFEYVSPSLVLIWCYFLLCYLDVTFSWAIVTWIFLVLLGVTFSWAVLVWLSLHVYYTAHMFPSSPFCNHSGLLWVTTICSFVFAESLMEEQHRQKEDEERRLRQAVSIIHRVPHKLCLHQR